MKSKNYNVGLDIGTDSVGFVATYNDGTIVRTKGKTIIGSRLFKEGETAADRRMFRTTRRRLKRRKWRLNLLETIFDPAMKKVDPNFFMRLKESNLVPSDSHRHFAGSLIFNNNGDGDFGRKYPTIYHLRKALIEEKQKFDLRMVYLAIHHIVKYRGNFLNSTPADQFTNQVIPFADYLDDLNEYYERLFLGPILNSKNVDEVQKTLLSTEMKRSDKQKAVAKLLNTSFSDKVINKKATNISTEISKALVENKTNLNKLLDLNIDPTEKDKIKQLKVQFNDENIDEQLDDIITQLDDTRLDILNIIRKWYAEVTLNQIIPSGSNISTSMVQKYDAHKKHLKMLKKVIWNLTDKKKKAKLKELYSGYIRNKPNVKRINYDTFCKGVKANLDDSDTAKEILDLIAKEQFMPKQRTSANGVIPHQVHQMELDRIIENQSKYYPWLAELNPNENRRHIAKYKIDELVAFHVPYYVGPLITKTEQEKTSGKQFAWMVRNKKEQTGPITPWNFDQKVNRMASANAFIKRMTTKDNYLIDQDVLPDESILYEKFKVLNELNMVRISGNQLSVAEKQHVFNDLFKKQKTISVKKLQSYLFTNNYTVNENVKITGLSDPKKFNNNLGTYIDFYKIFGDKVDDPNLQDTFERIIEWSTVFESRDIYKAKLESEVKWLTTDQINRLANKRYRGWGRLSKKLLAGLKNSNGERIIDVLWNTNMNFMQVQSQPDFKNQIDAENRAAVSGVSGLESTLDNAYTSSQNKKAIRQVIDVVDDIKHALHGVEPAIFSIEFTRKPAKHPKRTQSRYAHISQMYSKISREIDADLKEEFKEQKGKKMTDKLYLYFTQLGKDIYDETDINIDDLPNYEIDHILPQAFIKDDSLTNRVLTKSKLNNSKSDQVPSKVFGKKMGPFWRLLLAKGLISKYKFRNLTLDPSLISKYTKKGFIRRQIVETSQVIKLVANILGERYENSKIIEVPAKMNTQIRKFKPFIKNRFINDYHHAFDAYLSIFNGMYLYERFSKLRPFFVYGNNQYVKDSALDLKRFNFLYDLFDKDGLEKAKDNDYYQVVKKYRDILYNLMPKIYNYKFMLTTHEVFTKNGAMFDQTIYSPNSNKNNLIPIKNDKPTNLYGGYSGNIDSYMAVVRIKDGKKDDYKIVGVSRRWVDELNRVKDKKLKRNKLHDKLAPQMVKRGKQLDFEVILEKIMYRQPIIDGKDYYTIGGKAYKYNNRQLVLSTNSIDTLDHDYMKNKFSEKSDYEQYLSGRYDEVYQEIIDKMDKYFSLYDQNKFRAGIKSGYSKFQKLPNRDVYNDKGKKLQNGKLETLQTILDGLHANSLICDLKHLGIKTPFGQMQTKNGIKLSPDSIILFQSPTGLFERRVRLRDL